MTTPAPTKKQPSLSERALKGPHKDTHDLPYLNGLNEAQKQAVLTTEGPVLVLAGAGTGKTRALTTRIAHILSQGKARPNEILAVTFTNKATREMKNRIGQMIGGTVEGMPWLGTFHAIGVKILRRHAELVDLKSNFTILDTDDTLRLLKQLLKAENIDDKRWPPRRLASLIESWKNRSLTPEKVPNGESFAFAEGKGKELYHAYQARLKDLNAVDFGDLLVEMNRLLQNHPDVLAHYHRRFKYILVDEYQDTNVAQYLWLRLIAPQNANGSGNICCVGDDDQAIYGWRGAEVDNILRFEKDFKNASVIRLERNYRSTGHILAAASGLIAHNEARLGKTLHTEDGLGEKPTLQSLWDDAEEARTIGDEIEALQTKGHKLNEIAILVRASFQMRAFEDRFVTLGLPYRVIGGPRFYERMEVKDACAYFELVLNPTNDLKFERIINTPKRGLATATLETLHTHAKNRQISLFQAAIEIVETEELRPKPRGSLRRLLEQFAAWHKDINTLPHTELAERILDESGYTEMWQKDKSPQSHTRLENLKELIRYMGEFENLAGFMEHVSLVMDADADNDGDRVNLMTLHAAKGLEFDTVFLPGWEEGLFPHQRSLDEEGRAGLEEERRLGYVGITRAKKQAHISFTQNRRIHGSWSSPLPSRFIDELPERHIDVKDGPSTYGGYVTSRFENIADNHRRTKQRAKAPEIIDATAVTVAQEHTPNFNLGERIFHQKFGYGSIKEINDDKLTIEFEKSGTKRVLASFIERLT